MAEETEKKEPIVVEVPSSAYLGDQSNPLYRNKNNQFPGGKYVVGNQVMNGDGEVIGSVKVIDDSEAAAKNAATGATVGPGAQTSDKTDPPSTDNTPASSEDNAENKSEGDNKPPKTTPAPPNATGRGPLA